MEPLLSAIANDLLSRALSLVIQRYGRSKQEQAEHKLQRLQRVLLRIDATVEEAEGRHITNQAMLRQLETLLRGKYGGHYMLDTFRYRSGGGEVAGGRAVASPRFKRLLSFSVGDGGNMGNPQNTVLDAESQEKLEKVLNGLETLLGDMAEFAVFLGGYSRVCRQPYSTYLVLDKVMFGRHMETERIINFLLRPEAAGDGNPGVLPVVGAARVGKSTLVEHVCLDERVRGHFSLIVFFTGEGLGAGNMASLRGSGVIKHQDLAAASHGRSLAVIELPGDMEEKTWRRLYSSAASDMGHGSKIIITGRSEKIAALGTSPALRLKVLPQEAHWYFFKTLAFGSANPNDHPKLGSLGMEIAAQLNGAFLASNIVAGLMRDNVNAEFWLRVLQCLREYTRKHILTFGEHPDDRLQRDQSVHTWRMARTQHAVQICRVFQKPSPQTDVPKVTVQDILSGRVTQQGSFRAVAWQSSIPPYYIYLASCVSQTARCAMANKKRFRKAMG